MKAVKRLVSVVTIVVLLGGPLLALLACGESAKLPLAAGVGPQPQLPPPNPTLFPTVNIAPAVGWRPQERPTPAPGLTVVAFATGLDHPRNVYVLPNGDVLVAESNAPPKPDDSPGLRGFIMRRVMARAGAGVPLPAA
jgi:glucose/arabinose dehydrogenase